MNSIDLIKYLLVQGRECVYECLNSEQSKTFADMKKVWHYEDLLDHFNRILDREVT